MLIWPLFSFWAEICQIFRWFFGKFKNIKKTFWNYLTFSLPSSIKKLSSQPHVRKCYLPINYLSYHFSGSWWKILKWFLTSKYVVVKDPWRESLLEINKVHINQMIPSNLVKVRKSQKLFLLASNPPKTQRKYFPYFCPKLRV